MRRLNFSRRFKVINLCALFCIASPAMAADWKALSKVNEPPNAPSLRAAKAATQGLSREEVVSRWWKFHEILKRGMVGNATSYQILKREYALYDIMVGQLCRRPNAQLLHLR